MQVASGEQGLDEQGLETGFFVRQVLPECVGGQAQENVVVVLVHVPPFWHGLASHGSVGVGFVSPPPKTIA